MPIGLSPDENKTTDRIWCSRYDRGLHARSTQNDDHFSFEFFYFLIYCASLKCVSACLNQLLAFI